MNSGAAKAIDCQVIDCEYLSDLIEAVGLEDYCSLVKSFTVEAEAQVLLLEQRLESGDTGAVKASAHRLAGLLSQFGAFEVVSLAERIRESRGGDDMARMVAAMAALCRASIAAISARSDCDPSGCTRK